MRSPAPSDKRRNPINGNAQNPDTARIVLNRKLAIPVRETGRQGQIIIRLPGCILVEHSHVTFRAGTH